MKEQSLILLIGPPSIGKSTYVKNQFDPENTVVLSRDDIVQEKALSYGLTYDDLFSFPPADAKIGDIIRGYESFGEVVPTVIEKFKKIYPFSFSNIEKINSETEKELYNRFNSIISSNKNLAIDMTNTTQSGRKKFIDQARSKNPNIKIKGVVFNFQDPDALEILSKVAEKRRIEDLKKGLKKTITPEVFERIISSYEPPSKSEGFDDIVYIDTLPQLRKIANEINENMKLRKYIRKLINEISIDPEGKLIGWDDSEEIEMSKKERDKEFLSILKRYGVKDGRIIGTNMKEYWLPIEAKEEVELIGITWGYEDRATNREHPDYGKRFFVVDYDNVTF